MVLNQDTAQKHSQLMRKECLLEPPGSSPLAVPQSKTTTSGDAFSRYAPKLWNSQSEDLRGAGDARHFLT